MRIGLIMACLALVCQSTWASQTPLDHIVRTVRNNLEPATQKHARTLTANRYNIAIQQPDDRLKLPECSEPLSIKDLPFAPMGRMHLKVSCDGLHDWSLYVTAEVSYWLPILVTKKRMRRGTSPKPSDFTLTEMNVSLLRAGYLTDPTAVSGRRLRRSLAAGTAISTNQLELLPIISRGDHVEIQVKSGAIQVRTQGEALSDGSMDQKIRVRNIKSNRIISAIVEAPNIVRVGFKP